MFNRLRTEFFFCLYVLILTLLPVQQVHCSTGITESVRLESTQIRRLDSIEPNSVLLFNGKQGKTWQLLGDNGSMSVYSLDDSFNTIWSWSPKPPRIQIAALYNVQHVDEEQGTCLATNRLGAGAVYRFSFRQGQTVDSALLELPKPPYHIVQDIATKHNKIAFTARVTASTSDTLFAYVVDTITKEHNVWKIPVSDDIDGVGGSAIRFVDTTVIVLWQERVTGFQYRVRIVVYGIESKSILHSVVLADIGSPRFEWQRIWVDDSLKCIGIIAVATKREAPVWGLQYWKFNVESGRVDSTAEFLPEYAFLQVDDMLVTDNGKLLGVGNVRDVDQYSFVLVESSSRGILFEYDSSGTLVGFRSMQDQRPTKLNSLYRDREELLVTGQAENGSSFVARINEVPSTSIEQDNPPAHDLIRHVAWFTIGGETIDKPSDGAFVRLRQCSGGCYHSDLNLFVDNVKIGVSKGADHNASP